MRSQPLVLFCLLAACGGRPANLPPDGAGLPWAERDQGRPPDAAPPRADACVRPPGRCHSSDECPADQICSGCGSDPCCPMCDVCLGTCTPLPKGPCATNADCPEGAFCEHDGLCVVTGAIAGTCKRRPTCADTGACLGVCGCDGKTYCSSCEAHEAGVSVALGNKACLAPTCQGLDALYQAEVKQAKTCCAMCAAVQCVDKVPSALFCACETHVNQITPTMKALQAEYSARSCWATMPACGIKCAPPGPGLCASDGHCIDGGD